MVGNKNNCFASHIFREWPRRFQKMRFLMLALQIGRSIETGASLSPATFPKAWGRWVAGTSGSISSSGCRCAVSNTIFFDILKYAKENENCAFYWRPRRACRSCWCVYKARVFFRLGWCEAIKWCWYCKFLLSEASNMLMLCLGHLSGAWAVGRCNSSNWTNFRKDKSSCKQKWRLESNFES